MRNVFQRALLGLGVMVLPLAGLAQALADEGKQVNHLQPLFSHVNLLPGQSAKSGAGRQQPAMLDARKLNLTQSSAVHAIGEAREAAGQLNRLSASGLATARLLQAPGRMRTIGAEQNPFRGLQLTDPQQKLKEGK